MPRLVDGVLGLLLTTNLEMLAALDSVHVAGLAVLALETQHNLLGCLSLLVENGLGLSSVSRLLSFVTTLSCKETIHVK